MKRMIFAISVLFLMVMVISATASAIDTPWLPLEPDNTTTTTQEESKPSNETTTAQEESKPGTETTDSSTESTEVSSTTNTDLSDEKNDTATGNSAQPQNSDTVPNEDGENAGCGSVIGVYTVLITSVIAATVCSQKARKENI